MKMKKIVLVLLGGLMLLGLFGCGKKYHITYDDKSFYKGAKDSYKAGQKVTFYYDIIGTDTSYSFYLDGESISYSYDEKKGFVISFVMPEHDVTFSHSSRNDMVNMIEEHLLVVYSKGTSGIEDGNRFTTYSLYEQNGEYYIEKVEKNADKTETARYAVEGTVWVECLAAIKECDFEKWDSLKNYECLDGGFTSLWYDNGNQISVSTGKMPEDGQQQLNSIGSILMKYYQKAEKLSNQ